ncbi:MAG: hypothetical protein M1825_001319 [Sarcosagium campestre]|nr:MAG: hypothetical protein M1825_001319 [Sarcosagium campestre]
MPKEAEPSANERSFVLEALEGNIRIDGRAFDTFRPVHLSFGDEAGHADVQLGKTRVLARVSAEVTKPFSDRPFDGIFVISTELSPMASPAFEVGRQVEQEVTLSRILEKAIRRSSALDTESLCIIAGQQCWTIRVDVHVMDHDGGLTDASCVAVLAALQHFRRPDVAIEGERVTVYPPTERVPVPLSILHQPLCVSFSFFHAAETVLVDATLQEELLREGELIITMNKHGELCQMAKMGGVPVDATKILHCSNLALVKVRHLSTLISKRLDEDARNKDIGGLIAELSAENER